MSNCIELHDHTLKLREPFFDVAQFREWCSQQPDEEDIQMGGKMCHMRTSYYWFLKSNTSFKDGEAIISVGRGHSGHTWRDFKWLVWTLNEFFKQPFSHTFQVADEYDGFDAVGPLTVNWPYGSREELGSRF